MKEDKIKELLRKSKLETSDDFTDKLIHKIEIKKETQKINVWPFITVFLPVTASIMTLSYFLYHYFGTFSTSFNISMDNWRTPFFLIFSILFLMGINYIIRLNATLEQLKNTHQI